MLHLVQHLKTVKGCYNTVSAVRGQGKNPKKQICATDSRNKDGMSLWLIDGPRDALKQHGDFGCDANELLVPELVLQIAE